MQSFTFSGGELGAIKNMYLLQCTFLGALNKNIKTKSTLTVKFQVLWSESLWSLT